MATLERPRKASPAGERGLNDHLRADAPSAFPVDELVALRGHTSQLSPQEVGTGSIVEHLEVRETSTTPEDPFADDARLDDSHASTSDEHHRPPSYIDEDSPVPGYQERMSVDSEVDGGKQPVSRPDVDGGEDDDFHPSGVSLLTEKRRQDFTHLSDAIDRLNVVAPQLDNQRVALGKGKASELELARLVGRGRMDDQYATVGNKGKARAGATSAAGGDEAELLEIWQRIEKAHGRRISGQESTPLNPDQLESRRSDFMNSLVDRNDNGRLDDQDWTVGSQEASDLLTVDQFIQEGDDRKATSSSRPGAVSQPSSPRPMPSPNVKRLQESSALGQRGSSEGGPAQLVNRTGSSDSKEARRRPHCSSSPSTTRKGVSYVAEYQRNIRIVQVSLFVPEGGNFYLGIATDDPWTAVLVPSNSTATPIRLMLPAKAQPQVDSLVRPSSANTYSFRLSAMAGEEDVEETDGRALVAYSAKSLALAAPSALHCALCNAPLVDSSSVKPTDYSGLPSEHWEELIGSWLCHDEMKLDLGSEGAGGVFWPQQTEILVGGTYLMLKETLMLGQSWRIRAGGESDLWQPLVCSCCEAPIGRRFIQPHPTSPSSTVKLYKYAICLPGQPPAPFPAFICQDLLELADSHRSYHFILEAEENEGTPQLLIWLFNTSVLVTATPEDEQPSTASTMRAAKVLYTYLGGGTLPPVIPAMFPIQSAETLSYPAAVIDRLAAQLRRHNGAFPPSAQQMMGFHVSWVERF